MDDRKTRKRDLKMDAIKLRKELKKRKPKFRMTGFGERPCVKDRWRHPKGTDNKIAKGLKGYPKKVKIGYRSPKAARYIHPSGFKTITINNITELQKIDPKTEAAHIAATVGKKKQTEIINKCKEQGIKILNFDAEKQLNKIKEEIETRKEQKTKKKEDKEKKKKEKEKKAEEKAKKESKEEEKKDLAEKVEEEKEKEDKEKQKVLTKRE